MKKNLIRISKTNMNKVYLLFAFVLVLTITSCDNSTEPKKLITVDYLNELSEIESIVKSTYGKSLRTQKLDYLANTMSQLLCNDEELYLDPDYVKFLISKYGKPGEKPLRYRIVFRRSDIRKTSKRVILEYTEYMDKYFTLTSGSTTLVEHGIGYGEDNGKFTVGGIAVVWGN